jgi:MinD-like ATPase involved in chromosome partitioning or flagellar assembly
VTETGSPPPRMPWWDGATAAPRRPAPSGDPMAYQEAAPPARPAPPPAQRQPADFGSPVREAPQPPSGALSLGLGRGSRERELVRQVGAPVTGTRRVVVLSIKGGVGKTTAVAVTGSMLAGLRRDKVVALDASSDWGTLAARLSVVPKQSVRDLAARGRHAVSEHGVLAQLAASPSGLLVVGSDPQSAVSGVLTEEEYVQTLHLLEYVGSVIVTDVGAGLQQPFLPAALAGCDQLVVASAATWDAAQSAGAALDWLASRGYPGLVERSLVVVNNLYPPRRRRHGYVRDLKADLGRRARAVHEVPFDPALQPGGRILLRKLSAATRQAYLEIAADIMAGVAAAR